MPFYSWEVNFLYLAELVKHLQSGVFMPVMRRWALMSPTTATGRGSGYCGAGVFGCLAPGPLLTLAYARQMALRVVGLVGGGTCKSGRFIAGVCPCPP